MPILCGYTIEHGPNLNPNIYRDPTGTELDMGPFFETQFNPIHKVGSIWRQVDRCVYVTRCVFWSRASANGHLRN